MWDALTNHLTSNYKVNVHKNKINYDILDVLNGKDNEQLLNKYLENIVTPQILEDSFSIPQVFYMYDVLPVELVMLLHSYFLQRCCNSENIIFITVSHVGLYDWWEQYKNVMGLKSIAFIDAPFIGMYKHRFNITDKINDQNYWLNRKFEKHFTAWISGKQLVTIDNQYLMLLLLRYREQGIIDCCSPLDNKETLLAYAENTTNFCNAQLVDQVGIAYDKHIVQNRYHSNIEFVNSDGPSGAIGDDFLLNEDAKCPINIVRETLYDLPYYSFSEKSLRPFLHHQLVLPVGYNGYTILKDMGFKFTDLIDYSYSGIKNTNQRLTGMLIELEKLLQLPLSFFTDHHAKHIDLYEHNFYNVTNKFTELSNMIIAINQLKEKLNGKV